MASSLHGICVQNIGANMAMKSKLEVRVELRLSNWNQAQ